MRFKDTKQALEDGDVTRWSLYISGHHCEGSDLAQCLSADAGYNYSVLGAIIDNGRDLVEAEEYAKEMLIYEAQENWRSEREHHPDLFRGFDTPMISDEEMPEFEFDDDEILARVSEDTSNEIDFAWHEISAMVKKDPWPEAGLNWIGLDFSNVQIDGFICRACGFKSDFDGRHCTQCTAPICEHCFDNYCGVCGYDYNVEDKMEMEHGEA